MYVTSFISLPNCSLILTPLFRFVFYLVLIPLFHTTKTVSIIFTAWHTRNRISSPTSSSTYPAICLAISKRKWGELVFIYLISRLTIGFDSVDNAETAKLGWSRGTYMDTYAPALPKVVSLFRSQNTVFLLTNSQAILGTHGYKAHENYDPVWRHVRVPEAFLRLMCPEAEDILEKIEGVWSAASRNYRYSHCSTRRSQESDGRFKLLANDHRTSSLLIPGISCVRSSTTIFSDTLSLCSYSVLLQSCRSGQTLHYFAFLPFNDQTSGNG